MKIKEMRPLLAVGLTFLLVGIFLTVFGAIYNTSTVVSGVVNCGPGCSEVISGSISSAYYLYPVWSPPSWVTANYQPTSCSIQSWYTPLTPPASCVPHPDMTSANYLLNLVGVIWIVGGVAFLLKSRSVSSIPSAAVVGQVT